MVTLVSQEPFYKQLVPLVGRKVNVTFEGKINGGVLSIWTAKNGNEGWLVRGENEKGKVIFSGEIVDRVDIPLIGDPVVHLSF